MSWDDTILFLTSDIMSREGELLDNLSFVNRHEVVKHIIEERIKAKYPHIANPLDEIIDPVIFGESAICLNLSLVLRENSIRKEDTYAIRAEFYHRRYREEFARAIAAMEFENEDAGIEIIR